MFNQIYFNPLDCACKNITGAISQNETLQLNLFYLKKESNLSLTSTVCEADCTRPTQSARLHLNKDGEVADVFPMTITPFGWSISLQIEKIGLYFYTFDIEDVGFVSCGDLQRGVITSHPNGFMLTVYDKKYTTPDWFKGGVMYQIFPDRFCKEGTMPDINGRIAREDWGGIPSYKPNEQGKVLNNDFFGGNFKGIQSKLPYLKALGVSVIYFNPIFEAASNHRYDTANYMKIDPYLGDESDFASLIKAAKSMGIRIILDGVFNHTGDNSIYFNKYGKYPSLGAFQSKKSPYYRWYQFEQFPNKYSSWWGIDILPQVNERSRKYQNFIFGDDGVLKKWLNLGVSGYRLDVADELPDFFLKKLRKSVKESNADAIIIGEVWEDASCKVSYSERKAYLQGHELDSVMNYPLKNAIIHYIETENAQSLLQTVAMLIDHYPKQTLDALMNILGTHDTARILTVLGGKHCYSKDEMASNASLLNDFEKQRAIEKLKMASVLQYTLPGIPCIYYGDENAMEGHGDPFCRKCFNWNNLNQPLIDFYAKLGNIRNQYASVFKDGILTVLEAKNGLIYYKRVGNDQQTIYVFTNNSSRTYQLNCLGKFQNLINGQIYQDVINVQPYEYGIFMKVAEIDEEQA